MKRFSKEDASLLAGFAMIVAGVAWWSPPVGLITCGVLISATTLIRTIVRMRNETGDV